jgi:hypothetical protein
MSSRSFRIVIPGLYDGKGKAFFFAHFEQIRFPNSFTRTRTVFNSRVANGFFRYQFGTGATAEVREVNLLTLAAANGQIAAKDPITLKLIGLIDAATKTQGTRSASRRNPRNQGVTTDQGRSSLATTRPSSWPASATAGATLRRTPFARRSSATTVPSTSSRCGKPWSCTTSIRRRWPSATSRSKPSCAG